MSTPDLNKSAVPAAGQKTNAPSESRRERRQSPPALTRALIVLGCGVVLAGAGAFPLAGEISTAMADSPSVEATIVDVRFETPEAAAGEEAAAGASADGEAVPDPEAAPETAEAEEPAANDPLECSPVAGYTVDGQSYNASSNDFTADCDWSIGQEVKVAYDPENPVEARIVTEEFTPTTLILPVAGAAVSAAGLLMLFGARRNRKRS